MHPVPIGKRYKVRIEDHNNGKMTPMEMSLDDFQNLMNSRPGTVGTFIWEGNIPVTKDFSSAVTLPKGSKIKSVSYHVHERPSDGDGITFGTKENPSLIGEGKYDEPFEETSDAAELDKQETLGFTLKNVPEDKNPSGMVHVLVSYERFNEWPNLPHPEDAAKAEAEAQEKKPSSAKPMPQGVAQPGGAKAPSSQPAATAPSAGS